MADVSVTLTVLFDEPFWVGLYERETDGRYEVARVVFGAEPKDYGMAAGKCLHPALQPVPRKCQAHLKRTRQPQAQAASGRPPAGSHRRRHPRPAGALPSARAKRRSAPRENKGTQGSRSGTPVPALPAKASRKVPRALRTFNRLSPAPTRRSETPRRHSHSKCTSDVENG